MQAYQEAQEARQEALRQQQEALHQQQMLALSQHYQRQLTDLTGYFRSQMPGTDEPPASLFAPPEVPLSAPAPAPVPFPAQSAGSNPTPGASPPLGPSPPYQAYPTYPTQPYMYPPPSQGYSSWPPFPTQQGHSGPASVTAPQNRWNYGTSSQSGWRLYEHGGGSGTPGDDAQS
ncbi:unnamed protein product [Miscanthus lutarioriparius]|uniref:Uncharacterized protein n=2 Tax=Miscanthus lutarioriparius TaxID=422564 RepID=A0A811ND15_9POAL|nr:unnamed protein product [Miscanthus lutarioriparius]